MRMERMKGKNALDETYSSGTEMQCFLKWHINDAFMSISKNFMQQLRKKVVIFLHQTRKHILMTPFGRIHKNNFE